MGQQPSIPNFNFNIKSNCCTNGEKDEIDGNMVQSRRRSWLHRRRKTCKENQNEQERNSEMVTQSDGLQLEQANETEISYSQVSCVCTNCSMKN